MFHRRTKPTVSGEQENPFLLSFSDLMASLLAIFILALIVTMLELQKRKDELKKEQDKIKVTLIELVANLKEIQALQNGIAASLKGVNQREDSLGGMLDGIQSHLKSQGVAVTIAENRSVLRIPEQALHFDLGRYDIPATYSTSATAIGQALALALDQPSNRARLDTVFIEGHTDAVRNTKEMGNWGLSTYRAISLWGYWTKQPELARLAEMKTIPSDTNLAARPLISVSGYGETRSTHPPLEAASLPPDRPEDRRIDIRFTLATAEKKQLGDLQQNLKAMGQKTAELIKKVSTPNNAP